MGHRYSQRFALKGLGVIPVINGFYFSPAVAILESENYPGDEVVPKSPCVIKVEKAWLRLSCLSQFLI